MSFIKSLDDAGIICHEYDVATGWPKALDLERLVVLQYPDNERLQIVLHRTMKNACHRKEIASIPAMAWAGLYLGSRGTRTPFDKLLETADHAIDAPAFSEWLQRSDIEPSVHIAVWFAKFGILDCTTAPAQNTATPAPVVQATETQEKRQDRRLKACIDAGLPMNEKAASLRLPDGVANIAKSESVTRQAFSTDVKAALNRRDNAKREGVTVHRT